MRNSFRDIPNGYIEHRERTGGDELSERPDGLW